MNSLESVKPLLYSGKVQPTMYSRVSTVPISIPLDFVTIQSLLHDLFQEGLDLSRNLIYNPFPKGDGLNGC
jgi:hypothetical protein